MPVLYDKDFMNYTTRCALSSAEVVVPLVQSVMGAIDSVCDFGCAQGAWLSVWAKVAGADVAGVDGEYVDQSRLLIPSEAFNAGNLSEPIRLGRTFGLVQCLEVAEHIAPSAARGLVASLAAHGDCILFSAAPPGQGGLGHVNEQPYDYWRALFAEQGFVMFDCLRPLLADQHSVMPWYRYNLFLFARGEGLKKLDPAIRSTELPPGRVIPDKAPVLYRLRRLILRILPLPLHDWLARITAHNDNRQHAGNVPEN